MRSYKVIISGGGTGGHIFPGIAIANEIKRRNPENQILFVGAEGKMEMRKIPDAGYPIIGLWISGLQRNISFNNILFPFKVIHSIIKARKIVKEFKPDVVVGVGGYASAPALRAAISLNIPTLIQEQNSFAGITNKWLSKGVQKICVAYDNLHQYFPKNKIVLTGNPVRDLIIKADLEKDECLSFFKLNKGKPTILVIGGSLGAHTINTAIRFAMPYCMDHDWQVIWQTGALYIDEIKNNVAASGGLYYSDFIKEMDKAYSAADIIVSRAGAISVSELCIVGKPCILIPSPNVAEDHQTKNAQALVEKNAAVLLKDKDAIDKIIFELTRIINDKDLQHELSVNIKKLAKPMATEHIVEEIEKLISCN